MLVCVFVCYFCTRDRGCSAHPVFPAPSVFLGRTNLQNSGATCREKAELCLVVVARMSEATCGSAAVPHVASLMRATGYQRHCEERLRRSNPALPCCLDCFADARNDGLHSQPSSPGLMRNCALGPGDPVFRGANDGIENSRCTGYPPEPVIGLAEGETRWRV